MTPALDLSQPKVTWRPLPGSQALAMWYPGNVLVYHGTRGPGKTDSQLMKFRRRVGLGYGRYWRGIIFDREYKNLDDLVSKSLRWFKDLDGPKARFLSSKSDYRWVWETGEELLFRCIKRPSDYWGYHGQEFPYIGWNELTKYANDELFDMLMSCNRSSFLPQEHPVFDAHTGKPYYLPEIPLEVFATTNPYGVGHNWVKKRFINAAPAGTVVRKTVNVFNPRTQQREDVVKTQCHLFGSYKENKYLSPQYVAELEGISDPNKKKAWLTGSWDIVAGGMFDDVWDSRAHLVPPFSIPLSWRITRSFDWGSSKPFSVGWWAMSDGSDVQLPDGRWVSTVRGDLFRIAEWYGCTGKPNQGLRLLATQVSKGIVERQIKMGIHQRVVPGPADNSIWDVEDGSSIAANMQKPVKLDNGKIVPGVKWRRSNKAPGSRKHGWEQLRERLQNARPQYLLASDGITKVRVPREHPGIFAFNTCTSFADLFPSLPRDEEDQDDVDTDSEDHIGDEARYMALDQAIKVTGNRTIGT